MNSLNIKIGGAAGEGIKSIGLVLSKCFVRSGYHTFDYMEYPSLIRGGHNTYQAHLSAEPVFSPKHNLDILIAFNSETITLHQNELTENSLIIFDPDKVKVEDPSKLIGIYTPAPLNELATRSGGLSVMANNSALGIIIYLTQVKLQILKDIIAGVFQGKPKEIIDQNHQAAQAGYDWATQNLEKQELILDKIAEVKPQILLTGNEAVALGAISAGMKFYAAYPMTPTSSILTYMAANERKAGIVAKHAEDEISVINMAVGASFTGVRTMVATSGGGFCLMTEGMGLSGMMELPVVIVEGMRSGPSTGMPTWHDQGDLRFVIHASHGEFPRLVLAPADIPDCFNLARQAFYFAEKYQMPVILLVDKFIAESAGTMDLPKDIWENSRYGFTDNPDDQFKRYRTSADGISGRTIPGQTRGAHLSNGYEHDEAGYATEDIGERNRQVEKRLAKLKSLTEETEIIPQFITEDQNPEIGIISFGSNKGPIAEAVKQLNKDGIKTGFMNLNIVWPFPAKQVAGFLKNKKTIIDIECNSTGQLASLIKEYTGIEATHRLLKYDGRPWYPEEIVEKIKELK